MGTWIPNDPPPDHILPCLNVLRSNSLLPVAVGIRYHPSLFYAAEPKDSFRFAPYLLNRGRRQEGLDIRHYGEAESATADIEKTLDPHTLRLLHLQNVETDLSQVWDDLQDCLLYTSPSPRDS